MHNDMLRRTKAQHESAVRELNEARLELEREKLTLERENDLLRSTAAARAEGTNELLQSARQQQAISIAEVTSRYESTIAELSRAKAELTAEHQSAQRQCQVEVESLQRQQNEERQQQMAARARAEEVHATALKEAAERYAEAMAEVHALSKELEAVHASSFTESSMYEVDLSSRYSSALTELSTMTELAQERSVLLQQLRQEHTDALERLHSEHSARQEEERVRLDESHSKALVLAAMRHEAAMREVSMANEQLHAENKMLQAQRVAHTEEMARVQAELRATEAGERARTDESHSHAIQLATQRHEAVAKSLAHANEQLQAENRVLQEQRVTHAEQMQRLHTEFQERQVAERTRIDQSNAALLEQLSAHHQAAVRDLTHANEQLQNENRALQQQRLAHSQEMQRQHDEEEKMRKRQREQTEEMERLHAEQRRAFDVEREQMRSTHAAAVERATADASKRHAAEVQLLSTSRDEAQQLLSAKETEMAELRRALASQQAEIAESRAVEQRDHSRALADAASKAEEAAATVSATHAREREASAHQLAELTARLERATAQYEVAEREVAEACGRLQAQSQNHEAVLAEERQLLVQAEDMHAAEKQQLEVKHATAIAQLRAEYEAALVEERTKSDAAHQEVLSKTVAERESAIRQQKVEQERAYEDQRASEQKRHQHLLDELHAEKEALSEECGLLEERLRVRDDTLAVSTTSRYDELSAAVEPSGSGEVDNRIAHGGGVDGLGASPGLLNATDVHRLQEQIANLQGLLEPRDEADDLITAPRSRGEGFIGVNSRRTPSVRPRASPRSSSPGRSLMSPRPLSSSGPSRPQPVIPPDLDGELNSSHSRASVAGARRNVALSRAATDTAVAADSPTASSNAAVYTLVVDVGGVVSCAGRDKDVRILDPTVRKQPLACPMLADCTFSDPISACRFTGSQTPPHATRIPLAGRLLYVSHGGPHRSRVGTRQSGRGHIGLREQ